VCELLTWVRPEPGGYLQWDEVEASGTRVESVDESVPTEKIRALFRLDIPKEARGSDR
jgi:hypothetical protein